MNMRGNPGSGGAGPLILLFSPRERIRAILSIGLMQCKYRVIKAESSHLAMVKANQFLPDMLIMDITSDNTTDILLLSRLRSSSRTRSIPVVVIVPKLIRRLIDRIQLEGEDSHPAQEGGQFRVLEYPFNFTELQVKIKESIGEKGKDQPLAGPDTHIALADEKLTATLFDTQFPFEKKIAMIEDRLQTQWVFPFTVIKALEIIESDSSSSDLARCIKTDVAAASAILKVANTVHYATRSAKRVTDMQEAVVRLGFRETRNLLACMSLIDLSPELYKSYGFTRQEFWLHSLATGLIAERLCLDCGFRLPELAFVSGLIHDLGKIPLDVLLQAVFMHLLEETTEHIVAFHETEKKLLGFSHAMLAYDLTVQWHFPAEISQAILCHHDPERIMATPRPVDRVLQSSVFVANILAKALFVGHSCDEIIPDIPEGMLKDLRIFNGISDRFAPEIFRSIATFCRYLNLPAKDLFISRPHTAPSAPVLIVADETAPYHPLITALNSSGFQVKMTRQPTIDMLMGAQVVFHIPERGVALDVMLYEEEKPVAEKLPYLRIYLLDVIPEQLAVRQMQERNIFFMDRSHLDMRYIIHTLDHFLQRVVVPVRESVPETEAGEG
jgi:HD-like signal output (HDOD) protein